MLIRIEHSAFDNTDGYIGYALREYAAFFNVSISNDFYIERTDGKPQIVGAPFFVSFSHTKGAKVCAVSDKPIGVDIEYVRNVNYKAIAQRFFSGAEKRCGKNKFFKLWTAKEAYKKASGVTLFEALTKTDYKKIRQIDFLTDYALSVCCDGDFILYLFLD